MKSKKNKRKGVFPFVVIVFLLIVSAILSFQLLSQSGKFNSKSLTDSSTDTQYQFRPYENWKSGRKVELPASFNNLSSTTLLGLVCSGNYGNDYYGPIDKKFYLGIAYPDIHPFSKEERTRLFASTAEFIYTQDEAINTVFFCRTESDQEFFVATSRKGEVYAAMWNNKTQRQDDYIRFANTEYSPYYDCEIPVVYMKGDIFHVMCRGEKGNPARNESDIQDIYAIDFRKKTATLVEQCIWNYDNSGSISSMECSR